MDRRTPAAGLLDLTRELKELARLATHDDSLDDLLQRGLTWLARLAPYDLAAFFALEGDSLVIRSAAGPLAGEVPRGYALPLARFPTIREALESRRARAFTEDDHTHGDGDPYDGVLDLAPGHSCMVVPLYAGERSLGALTLDRTRCERYPQSVVDLVEVYGWILALALTIAEQRMALQRQQRHDEEHAKLLDAELHGTATRILEESNNARVRALTQRARQVAETDTPVLILGETGTGKERFARAIHAFSRRAERSFVKINCAAIPAGLLESELFGHVKGAFTGATRDRPGRFQIANGGTLLLDEIGELPLDLQSKLLRVLQEGTFEPVGSDRTVRVDVRILAATHVDLVRAIHDKRFREDLYYRLSVFPLELPPLRERLEDLPRLCESLLAEQESRTGRRGLRVSREGLAKLKAHAWPGNIRELANVLERAAILSESPVLGPNALDLPTHGGKSRELRLRNDGEEAEEIVTLDEAQRRHIRRALARAGGRLYGKGGAAELLGMKPTTLQSRMKKLGITSE